MSLTCQSTFLLLLLTNCLACSGKPETNQVESQAVPFVGIGKVVFSIPPDCDVFFPGQSSKNRGLGFETKSVNGSVYTFVSEPYTLPKGNSTTYVKDLISEEIKQYQERMGNLMEKSLVTGSSHAIVVEGTYLKDSRRVRREGFIVVGRWYCRLIQIASMKDKDASWSFLHGLLSSARTSSKS